MKKWETISSKTILSNEYFEVVHDDCKRDGELLSPYYVIKQSDSVVVCPVTKENNVVLIKQYRHPVNSINIELPAGHLFTGEDVLAAAKRELKEETGYEAETYEKTGEVFSSAGLQNNKVHFYLAKNAVKTSEQNLDEHEDIEVFELPLAQALELLKNGEIKDMGSTLCLMLAKEKLAC